MSRSSRAERVYLDVLGCRLNQSEIERMAGQFAAVGWLLVDSPGRADWVIVNTCAVTATAERKSRQAIHRAHRANPAAHIIVTGCYAELAPGRLAALPGVAQVVGNADKEQIVQGLVGKEIPEHPPTTLRSTRAFVKVQDGCNHRCTYCITTRLRGPSRSRPLEEIVCEVCTLAARGVREAVLTGVHLGAYGRDLESGASLRGLIAALLEETTMPRLRLSSLEPWGLADDFFDLWRSPRLCPHLHLPLQSGCAATLRRMARRAAPETFARLAGAARAHIPDLALTTDVMVGFPGETDGEFEESFRFVEAMDFARLHVFRYSPRPETAAARMPDQVPETLKRAHGERLLALGRAQREDFARRYVGRTMDVLWETARKRTPTGRVWTGLTGNYIRVTTITPASAENLYNTITPTRLLAVRGGELVGEVDGVPTPAGVLPGISDEFSS